MDSMHLRHRTPANKVNYIDYANLTDNSGLSTLEDSISASFPVTLHRLLSEVEEKNLEHIIAWCPHGRSLIVRDHDAMEKEILPLWFRQKKYSSFQRQLNIYGFQRLTSGEDKGAYYHERFLRGKLFLACTIERQRVKGTGRRKAADSRLEPKFYLMNFLPLSSSSQENGCQAVRAQGLVQASIPPSQVTLTDGSVDSAQAALLRMYSTEYIPRNLLPLSTSTVLDLLSSSRPRTLTAPPFDLPFVNSYLTNLQSLKSTPSTPSLFHCLSPSPPMSLNLQSQNHRNEVLAELLGEALQQREREQLNVAHADWMKAAVSTLPLPTPPPTEPSSFCNRAFATVGALNHHDIQQQQQNHRRIMMMEQALYLRNPRFDNIIPRLTTTSSGGGGGTTEDSLEHRLLLSLLNSPSPSS